MSKAQAEHFCPGCLERTDRLQERCARCDFERPELGWPVDETIGKVVNQKYRITERLGRGGFGVVMRGRHLHDEHDLGDVVLKFMQSSLAQDLSLRKRFINEARAARSLRSPHMVKVFDFDFDEHGVPFMVMEYLEGEALSRIIRRRPLSVKQTLDVAAQLASAMQECHAAGIIHRDLKPSNVVLQDGFAKIIDFGIARMEGATVTRTLMGTPKYMAPEQIQRGEMDGRTDIFALGVIIHECLCGAPPIAAGDDLQYLMLNLEAEPTPLREVVPDAPVALEGLLLRMMAKDPDDRPVSMADVAARLRAMEAGAGEGLRGPTPLEDGDTVPLIKRKQDTRDVSGAQEPSEPSRTLGSWIFDELPEHRGRRVAAGVGGVSALALLALLLVDPCGGQTERPAAVAREAVTGTRPPDAGQPRGRADASALFVPRTRRVAGLVPEGKADVGPPDAGPRPAVKKARKDRPQRRKVVYPSLPDAGMW